MCRNMKFISSVDQDISQVSKANEWDILFNTRNNFGLLFKKILPTVLPHKNRAVNSNAFHDNRHM